MRPLLLLTLSFVAGCVMGKPGDVTDTPSTDTPATDEEATRCDPTVDADHDGTFAVGDDCAPVDCDDTNPAVYPQAVDLQGDGTDSDCDGDDDCGYGPPFQGWLAIDSVQDMRGFCRNFRSTTGDVTIEDVTDADDLSDLSCLCAVGEDLLIRGNNITSLAGLEGLTGVMPGYVDIYDNPNLEDFTALSGITGVTGELFVSGQNTGIGPTTLSGLRSIRNAGALIIGGWPLESLSGLDALESIDTVAEFSDLNIPDLSGLDALTTAGARYEDGSHDVMHLTRTNIGSVGGLTSLTALPGGLVINEPNLTSLVDLPVLNDFGGLIISDSDAFNSLAGIEWVTELGFLGLQDLPLLTTLRGLDGLTQVTSPRTDDYDGVEVDNVAITNLDGLESLRVVGGDVYLRDNPNLVDLSALHSVESIDGALVIQGNAILTSEEAWALVDAIGEENIAGGVYIEDNYD